MYSIYFHQDKVFDKSLKLKKLERNLFNVLINVYDDLSDNKKYQELAKFLVRRFTIWKPTPAFPVYLSDIPVEIKKELIRLVDPELDELMNIVIDKIFQYSLWDEKYFDYKYFLEEIQKCGLLNWRLI